MMNSVYRNLAAFVWAVTICLLLSVSIIPLAVLFWVLGGDDIHDLRTNHYVCDLATLSFSIPSDTPSFAALIVMLFIVGVVVVEALMYLHWRFIGPGGDDAHGCKLAREAQDVVVVVVSICIVS
jgi:hypothetical protein